VQEELEGALEDGAAVSEGWRRSLDRDKDKDKNNVHVYTKLRTLMYILLLCVCLTEPTAVENCKAVEILGS